VADFEEDDDIVGVGEETMHFGGGGRPTLQHAMTSS
jgi:hypothetical protein